MHKNIFMVYLCCRQH